MDFAQFKIIENFNDLDLVITDENVRPEVLCLNTLKFFQNRDAQNEKIFNKFSNAVCDGASICLWFFLINGKFMKRLCGVDIFEYILSTDRYDNSKVAIIGGRQDNLEQLKKIYNKRTYLLLNGFQPLIASEIEHKLKSFSPDFLFVALPSPEKESFIIQFSSLSGIKLAMGIGGSLEVLVGEKKRAPKLLQKIGMEWFFRMIQSPWILGRRYLKINVYFFIQLVKAFVLKVLGFKKI